jgi:hypothetical protein
MTTTDGPTAVAIRAALETSPLPPKVGRDGEVRQRIA